MSKLGRRALQLAVLFFAALGFTTVPLGERTGLQHLQRILATVAVSDAARDVSTSARELVRRLTGESPVTANEPPDELPPDAERPLSPGGADGPSTELPLAQPAR